MTHADVYAALAYYHDHREEIVARMKQDEELDSQLRAKQGPSRLEKYLRGDACQD